MRLLYEKVKPVYSEDKSGLFDENPKMNWIHRAQMVQQCIFEMWTENLEWKKKNAKLMNGRKRLFALFSLLH